MRCAFCSEQAIFQAESDGVIYTACLGHGEELERDTAQSGLRFLFTSLLPGVVTCQFCTEMDPQWIFQADPGPTSTLTATVSGIVCGAHANLLKSELAAGYSIRFFERRLAGDERRTNAHS